jgi:hypothetical protein
MTHKFNWINIKHVYIVYVFLLYQLNQTKHTSIFIMSRQYSNGHTPSDNSSRRFRQSSQNDFSYFQYPPHREINNLPFSRITVRNFFSITIFE